MNSNTETVLKARLKELDRAEANLRGKVARGEVTQKQAEWTAGFLNGQREMINKILVEKPTRQQMQHELTSLEMQKAALDVRTPRAVSQQHAEWAGHLERFFANS